MLSQNQVGRVQSISEPRQSGDHIYFYLNHQGNQYTVGKLSHSWRGDLNATQIMMLARKMLLQKREFERFIDCSLDTPEVVRLFLDRRGT